MPPFSVASAALVVVLAEEAAAADDAAEKAADDAKGKPGQAKPSKPSQAKPSQTSPANPAKKRGSTENQGDMDYRGLRGPCPPGGVYPSFHRRSYQDRARYRQYQGKACCYLSATVPAARTGVRFFRLCG